MEGDQAMTAQDVMGLLNLEPLDMEGGYFRQNYRSTKKTEQGKPAATAIYFLLTPDSFSRLHKLPTDEVYHFYLGDPVELLLLSPNQGGQKIILGNRIEQGMKVQAVAPACVWQGSRLLEGGSWALLGTTMSPGFTDEDFIPAQPEELKQAFPKFAEEIDCLTWDK